MHIGRVARRNKIGELVKRNPRLSLVYGMTAGISTWTFLGGQLSYMARNGWDVLVIAAEDGHLTEAAQRDNVAHMDIPMSREISFIADLFCLMRWIIVLCRVRPKVVNVGTPKAGLLGGIAARITCVPRRVYVVRGLRYEGATGWRRRLLISAERLSINCATDVVVVSRSVAEQLRRDRVTRRPLFLIGAGSSNGIDARALASKVDTVDKARLISEIDVTPGALIIGYIGRVTADKGADTLARCAGLLESEGRNAHFLIIGDVEDVAIAEQFSALEHASILGWTSDPWKYLAIIDILILPTLREGYPNVVLEANACHVPVITTRVTGAVDSVIEDVTGVLVEAADAVGLASAITTLQEDSALRRRLADNARKRVFDEFSQERIWMGLDSIYSGSPNADVKVVN